MEALREEIEQLEKTDNLGQSVEEIQKLIDLLSNARKKIEEGK